MIIKKLKEHRLSLFTDRNTFVYFDSFGIEYVLQEVLKKIKDKVITHNIFRIPVEESIMCWYQFILSEWL